MPLSMEHTPTLSRSALMWPEEMPREVFDTWIKPHIEHSGEPPSFHEDPLEGNPWYGYLRGRSPKHWSSARWQLVKVMLAHAPFEERALNLASQLAARWSEYEESGTWRQTVVPDSRERLESCLHYLRLHRSMPAPLICAVHLSSWLVLDGHHRLAALKLLPEGSEIALEVWLCQEAP